MVDPAVDAIRRLIELIKERPGSRENSLTVTKLEEAEMWLIKGGGE